MIRAVAAGLIISAGTALADDGQVSGIASYRERIMPPPGAVFEAVLQDVSRADAPAAELGRVTIADAGGPPYRFAIPYEKNVIDDRHVYAVRTTLHYQGQLIFTSDTTYPVLTRGASDEVEIMMVRASAGSGAGEGALRPRARGGAIPVAGEEPPAPPVGETPPPLRGFVTFSAEAAHFTDCATGRQFRIAKAGDYAALEHAYVAAGQEPGRPVLASFDGRIVEEPPAGGNGPQEVVHVDRFVGVWTGEACQAVHGDRPLVETRWQILRIGDTVLETEGDRPVPFVQLQAGGDGPRFAASVGCNTMAGSFGIEAGRLRFGQVITTLMACPQQLADAEELLGRVLGDVRGWRIAGDRLELLDEAGAVIAELNAAELE